MSSVALAEEDWRRPHAASNGLRPLRSRSARRMPSVGLAKDGVRTAESFG
jgi:ribosomal protein L32E